MLNSEMINYFYSFYKNYLLNGVMSFWEKRTIDHEYGGYFTCFNREGNLTDRTKYIWFQGRQLWMFSNLYNEFKDEKWQKLAKHGRDFLVKNAYSGDGRWHYQLSQEGKIEKSTVSIFTDLFVLSGLAEYAKAINSDEDIDLIKETYSSICRNINNPEFKDIYHNVWHPDYDRHGLYMISLIVAPIVGEILGREVTKPFIDECLYKILYVFAKDEHEVLLEVVGRNGEFINNSEGRISYPGHTFESCWAAILEGRRRNDKSIIDRALKIYEWGYRWGYDKEYGGIYSYIDIGNPTPAQFDWNKETNMSWDDKNFWVNAEALAISAVAYGSKRDMNNLLKFIDLSDWTYQKFFDKVYGEWYTELYRDGSIKLSDKGTLWKAAYHVPRSLMIVMKEMNLLKNLSHKN